MADAAFRQMGRILEFGLYKSQFTWIVAKFPVFADYYNTKAIEFQPAYLKSDVDQAHFDRIDHVHFDDLALVHLSCGIWLSPVVDEMQRFEKLSISSEGVVAYREGAAAQTAQTMDTLTIGGYTRDDGSYCPTTVVIQKHVEPETSSYTAIIPHKMIMPPLYSKTGFPGAILTQPPNPMLPPD
jgi:hypothetical protein